ncbi:aldo/keto reductase [Enterococcus thailandicus]|uniref:aldo/keto reductase n=1 Tax=Enterococcus thailandicus TaxID=417368 RepID=UPI0022EBB68B|nr:aldo/keto reductase [Enterococcus thailandicus]MDA3973349.1 aldo/keto reductase [Enterococcus thailandicus]MDA3976066.1 aldo/keto reductase [Enterococcus thailandicus]MDA3980808.1 aldo/keto reductase [Enterococcus thailandicus]
MIQSLSDKVILNNGQKIPGLGLGVFQIPNEKVTEVVKQGIINGYRLIDTAQIYGNEEGTGKGMKEGLVAAGLTREDLFITSKIWNAHLSQEEALESFNETLTKLQIDYLDLFLIHWPGKHAFKDSWLALEKLYDAGKIKSIGVSNFEVHHLEELATFSKLTPALNQIELHPKLAQHELRAYGEQHNIKIQAWSPLMQGQLLTHPLITEIAAKHQKTPAQIILRWDIQQQILLVVKSVHEERMRSNADIFDFHLDDQDMEKLNALNEGLRSGPNPDEFDF